MRPPKLFFRVELGKTAEGKEREEGGGGLALYGSATSTRSPITMISPPHSAFQNLFFHPEHQFAKGEKIKNQKSETCCIKLET